MFFWIGLAVVFLVFVFAFSWGTRDIEQRRHKPGTQRLR